MKEVKFTKDELEDILSALSYFIRRYPDEGATETKAAMKKIFKKIQRSEFYLREKDN